MGIKSGLGNVAARVGQSHGFEKTVQYGHILASGIDITDVAISTFAATLRNSLSNLRAYADNVYTSKSYLDVVRAQAEVVLSEMGEMKQLALQAQNASATDRLSLQASLDSKQKTIARKLVNAEFGGVNIFTNSTNGNNFVVGNGLNINANIDAATGMALVDTAGIWSAGVIANTDLFGHSAAAVTDLQVKVKIYGEATVTLSTAGQIDYTQDNFVYLSPGTVAIFDYYAHGTTDSIYSYMLIGSTNGGAGLTGGAYATFASGNPSNAVFNFYGNQSLSSFPVGNTVISGGVFNVELTGSVMQGTANGLLIELSYDNVQPVGAIGDIDISNGAIDPGTACTIDTTDNAIIAANVIEAGMDQISNILSKIDNLSSALSGVMSSQIGQEEALGTAVEDLTAADITQCMSEIVSGQAMVQYTTAVWAGQQKLNQLALKTFQQAVAA